MIASTNAPRGRDYLSLHYLTNKVREKGVVWCLKAGVNMLICWVNKLMQSGLVICIQPIRARFWCVVDKSRYKGRAQPDVLYAFYDLAVAPATFDIVKFLVLAEIERKDVGCDSIHFVIVPGFEEGFRKGEIESYHRTGAMEYDTEHLHWRLRNILVPCCWQIPSCQQITVCTSRKEALLFPMSLAKYVFPKGYTVRFPKTNYTWRHILDATPNGTISPTLKATPQACRFVKEWIRQQAGERKVITITLRESSWHKDRNSSLKDWGAFTRYLDQTFYCPVVIRDTEAAFKPLPAELEGLLIFPEVVWNVELRVALYELSYLNMFTNSGPASLCRSNQRSRSITFKMITNTFSIGFFRTAWGVEPGSQMRVVSPSHLLVWEDDKLEVIQKAFREMCDKIERTSTEHD